MAKNREKTVKNRLKKTGGKSKKCRKRQESGESFKKKVSKNFKKFPSTFAKIQARKSRKIN